MDLTGLGSVRLETEWTGREGVNFHLQFHPRFGDFAAVSGRPLRPPPVARFCGFRIVIARGEFVCRGSLKALTLTITADLGSKRTQKSEAILGVGFRGIFVRVFWGRREEQGVPWGAVALPFPGRYGRGMQIHITPRHLRLTAAIHQATASQVSLLEDLGAEILGAHVVLMHDEVAKPADRYTVKVHLAVSGPDIHAEQSADDLYIALEKAVDKLARQLRKRKTAIKDKRRSVAQRATERAKNGEVPVKAAKKAAKRSAK